MTILWKLLRQALPVDSRKSTKDMQLASKCRCCNIFAFETVVHPCLHSEVAREVWRCFGKIFRLPSNFQSISQAIKIWFPKIGALSHYAYCRVDIMAYCFWEIWIARYEATYEGRKMGARRI